MTVTRQFARFLAETRPDDIPERVRHEAKRSLMNFFAGALGGCRDEAVEMALAVLTDGAASGRATIIGRSETTDPLDAAFLNAISSNVLDFDDTHLRTVIHPSAPVAPAVFALAQQRPISGATLIDAFILGVEAECRVGNAVSPSHYRRGWHITATCGVIGAAVAAGKLLHLDATRMAHAIGGGAHQSAGLIESLGSMAKSIGVGNAARGGLLAALFAERGYTGPDQALEGPRGFFRVMGDGVADLSAVSDGLGDTWEIMQNTYKPYPCGVVLHPVIDGCLELRAKLASPDVIEHISIKGHPLLRERADRPHVTASREAAVSLQHTVAVAFLRGAAGVREYTDACVNDPAVLAFRRKVEAQDDPNIPVEAAVVSVRTTAGETLTAHVRHARGSLTRPLSDGELEMKLRDLAAYGAPDCDAKRLIGAIWGMDKYGNVGDLLPLSAPAAK